MADVAPLAFALGIRTGSKVSLLHAPSGFVERLSPLPPGVEFLESARTGLDVILFFTASKHELVERLPAMARSMAVNGGIWVCWPTHPEGPIDRWITEDFVRLAGLEIGLVDNKRHTLDDRWSGLRLVWRPRGPRPERSTTQEISVA